jgi:SAM-dependent methyltransferase
MDPRLVQYTVNIASREARLAPDSREELFIHFGHWDDPEAASMETFAAAQRRLNERALELAAIERGNRVLDVGCGFGGTLSALDASFEGLELVGLNLDARQLAVARRAVPGSPRNRISWVEADACELPFAAATFDRVLAIESAVHYSRRRFLVEAARILAPGGRVVVTDVVATPDLARLRARGELPATPELIEEVFDSWDDFWGRDVDYDALAANAGLRVETRIDATRETLPSYRLILDTKASAPADDPNVTRPDRVMIVLGNLQARGAFRQEYLTLVHRDR